MKTPDVFGRSVSKYFDTLRSQLTRDPPNRQGFLRMLKDICEYLAAKSASKKS